MGKINCNCKLVGFTLQRRRRGIPHKSSPVPVYEVVQHDKLLIVVGQGIPHKFQVYPGDSQAQALFGPKQANREREITLKTL